MGIEKQYEEYCKRMEMLKKKPNINDTPMSACIPIPFKEFKNSMDKI